MDFTNVSLVVALLLSIFNLWDKIETRIKQAKEPTKQLENRIIALEQLTSQTYQQKFAEYDEHFAKDLMRIDSIEQGTRVTQKAILALLKHAVDGNETDALKEASKELTKYLIER